jgi:excisionase family DNA binding protein
MPRHEGQLSLPLFETDSPQVVETRIQPEPTPSPPRPRRRAASAPATSDESALLTTSEAADLLHVHPRTVQRLVERGEFAAVHLGTAVRFDRVDLTGLVARVKRRAAAEAAPVDAAVRARGGARVSFAERLRSHQHEHRAAEA